MLAALRNMAYQKLMPGPIGKWMSSAKYLPELLMVAKYFERIGDLSKRVAAWAIFRVTGEHKVEEKASQAGGLEQ